MYVRKRNNRNINKDSRSLKFNFKSRKQCSINSVLLEK